MGNMRQENLVETFRRDVMGNQRGHIAEVADATGIPLNTLRNLYYGRTTAMRYPAMLALTHYYAQSNKARTHR